MGTRLLVIFLCLGVLSTVPGCYVAPTSSGTSASGGGTDAWGRQDGGPYHPWERPSYGDGANTN